MDPLPWGAFVAPQFRRGQFYQGMKPPEPDAPASSSAPTKTPVWKPQPIRIANDAQGYSKSQLHKLDMSQEIERLLSMSASDERLSEMHSVPELIEDMRSKLQLLEESARTQELTISRLREDARKMEEEQHELSALQSELAMGVDRAKSYLQARLSSFIKDNGLSEADIRKILRKNQAETSQEGVHASGLSQQEAQGQGGRWDGDW